VQLNKGNAVKARFPSDIRIIKELKYLLWNLYPCRYRIYICRVLSS